jgi:dynein light chain LC8-type
MATALKQLFDKEHQPTWQSVIGKNFGSSITHETKYILFFQIDQTYVLLFKSLE